MAKKSKSRFQKQRWIDTMNTQQKIGLGLMAAGIILLPTVYAYKTETVSPTIQKDANGNTVVSYGNTQNTGSGYIQMNGQTVAVTPAQNSRIVYDNRQSGSEQTLQQLNSQMTGIDGDTGPAARQNTYAAQAQSHQDYQAPQPFNQTAPSCEYYDKAGRAGFYHFRFDEPSAGDLVTYSGRHQVHREALNPLRDMVAAAKADGATLTVGSAFRSKEYQRGIVNRKTSAGQSVSKIYKVSSHPGFSEHHTGYAVDFTPIDHSFANSKGYRWLKQHAHEYGFYQTFTAEYSAATGISQESWHWKYLGTPNAKQVLANSNCYQQDKSTWRAVSQ